MTDKERLAELQKEIHRFEKVLKPLYEERKVLKQKIKEEERSNLSYQFTLGIWFQGKSGEFYLYWNTKDCTYYKKPLYKSDGHLHGHHVSKTTVSYMEQELIDKGYTLVE